MKDKDLIQNLTSDLTPVRPLSSPIRSTLVWLVSALLLVGFGLFMMPLRNDLAQKISQASFIFLGAGLLFASALSALAISWIGRPGRPGQRLLIVASFLWIGGLISLFSCRVFQAASHSGRGVGCDLGGARCMIAISMLSILPGSLFFWRSKKTAPLYPGLSGGLIGLASGTLGATAIAFSCSNDEPSHLLIWHFLAPVSVLSVLGFITGRKYLRW